MKLLVSNKNAHRNYFIEDEFEAGIVLHGTEVKSLSHAQANMNDAYVYIKDGEAFILNMYIAPFKEGNRSNVDPYATRKLLLHKSQILKLTQWATKDSLTIVPIKAYWSQGHIKILIGLGKGKKLHDKREDIKKRDMSRMAHDY